MKDLCAGMTRQGTECSKWATKNGYCCQHQKPTPTFDGVLEKIKEKAQIGPVSPPNRGTLTGLPPKR